MAKNQNTCSVVDCNALAYCKGYCESHYRRFSKYGDPLSGRTRNGAPVDFLRSVAKTDQCIDWPYLVNEAGYGQVRLDGKMMNAHRAALIIHNGKPELEGAHAAHKPIKCHNRRCVNPRHLRWATPSENMRDRALDGTQARLHGTKHGAAKLTEADVVEIRRAKTPQRKLALEYGVSLSTINGIILGKRWKHV